MPKTVLILGGTAEGRALADALVDRHGDGLRVISSLAGRTANPRHPKGEVRTGGFGGAEGLATYLTETGVDLIVDATHPFAARISAQAADACERAGVARLMLVRPPWDAADGDRWIPARDTGDAADLLQSMDGPCLITTGINELAAFKDVTGPKLIVRLIEPPTGDLPLADVQVVIGTPPYRQGDEVVLFGVLGLKTLVTKNAGGDATRAKIDAARQLGVAVIMIARPSMPAGHTVATVDDAMTMIAETLSL